MKYYLQNMNLINKNEKICINCWFFAKRFFTKDTIDKFLEKNKLKPLNDTFTK